MVIMALDHARDYFNGSAYLFDPTDLRQTSVPLFLTRWITHFCAPIFMLLSGVAACLYGMKNGRKALSFFLLTRGIWLILVELFIVTVGWTFNTHFTIYILQVIWAFGVSMIVLSGLVYAGRGWLRARRVSDHGPWIIWADGRERDRLRTLVARSRRGMAGHPASMTTPKSKAKK